jgi:hypothetical protein
MGVGEGVIVGEAAGVALAINSVAVAKIPSSGVLVAAGEGVIACNVL